MREPKNPLNKIENAGAIMILTSIITIAEYQGKSFVTIAELKGIKKGLEL